MSSRVISSLSIFALAFSIVISPAAAFIDTEGLESQLKNIQGELDPAKGIENLLGDLEKAAQGEAQNYLQATIGGKAVTMWDVPKTAWFYQYVLALMELQIVSGYKNAAGEPSGAYGPADNVTREQAMKIAVNSAGIDTVGCEGDLETTKISEWAKPFAACAAAMNFGIKAGADLKAPATRAEVLHYLLRAFAAEVPEGTPPFDDSKKHMYKNDIAYAYALGIVSGDKNADGSLKGTFRPDANVNRAETAKMAKLAIELL